jgi:hypothetical protein
VVDDERRVDSGAGSHRTKGGTPESVLEKEFPRGFGDALPGRWMALRTTSRFIQHY